MSPDAQQPNVPIHPVNPAPADSEQPVTPAKQIEISEPTTSIEFIAPQPLNPPGFEVPTPEITPSFVGTPEATLSETPAAASSPEALTPIAFDPLPALAPEEATVSTPSEKPLPEPTLEDATPPILSEDTVAAPALNEATPSTSSEHSVPDPAIVEAPAPPVTTESLSTNFAEPEVVVPSTDEPFHAPVPSAYPEAEANLPTTEQPAAPEHVASGGQYNFMPAVPAFAESAAQPLVVAGDDQSVTDTSENLEYISNPYLNTVRGLVLTLQTNPVSTLLSALVFLGMVLTGLFLAVIFGKGPIPLPLASLSVLTIGAELIFGILFCIPLGSFYVIGGHSARGEKVTTRQALGVATRRLLSFLIMSVAFGLLVSVGLLLLIIPGVILLARGALAPLILFEENLGPVAAIKRSFELTKGHVNEMLGAYFAGLFVGGGGYGYSLVFGATSVAPLAGRYHDLRALKESGAEKPKVHWLNYTYILGIVIMVAYFGFIIFAFSSGLTSKAQPTNSFSGSSSTYDLQPSKDSLNGPTNFAQ